MGNHYLAYGLIIATIVILLIILFYFMSVRKEMRFFGPHQWHSIHAIISKYDPKKQKNAMRDYLNSLKYLLPCEKCRSHYKVNLQNRPFEPFLDNRGALFHWAYLIHDDVNKQLGKTSPTYNTVKRFYEYRMKTKI